MLYCPHFLNDLYKRVINVCFWIIGSITQSIRLEFGRVVKHFNHKPCEGILNVWQKPLLRVRNTDDIK